MGVGGGHTCVINKINDDLICFGKNKDGQLDIAKLHVNKHNINININHVINHQTINMTIFERVSAGVNFTCVY